MAPIKGEWIINKNSGYVVEGFFDLNVGYAKIKLLRTYGSYYHGEEYYYYDNFDERMCLEH
jgi:hypothetical protein